MNNINIAELLKDCPKGTKLYSTIFGEVELKEVKDNGRSVCIFVTNFYGQEEMFYPDGKYNTHYSDSECTLFPSKEQRDWSKFCPFKDGDVLSDGGRVFIFNRRRFDKGIGSYVYNFHCVLAPNKRLYVNSICFEHVVDVVSFATEEEKEKLLQAIKDNGYEWDADTKTLEKLVESKFKVGDWITINKPCQIISINDNGNYIVQYCDNAETQLLSKNFCESHFHLWTIKDAKDGDVLCHSDSASNGIFIFKEISQRGTTQKVICYCDYDSEDGFCLGENHTCCWADSKILHPATKEQCDILFQKTIEAGYEWNADTKTLEAFIKPKFKVGDYVTKKGGITIPVLISRVGNDYYYSDMGNSVGVFRIKEQDDWELVPNKFDVTTLKPFDKVLVRNSNKGHWRGQFYMAYTENEEYPFECTYDCWMQCIPYEGNEHLLATTDDCDEYYKNW